MAKSNNRGFSLTELIIAIAVFTILLVPIIRQLSVSMNISNKSRATQESAEYAEYLVEYFKSTPLADIGKDNLFDGSNALQLKNAETDKTISINGTNVTYKEMSYEIPEANAVTIGRKKYYSEIVLDTKEYAASQAGYRSATSSDSSTVSGSDGKEYVAITAKTDPNQVNVGHLTNLDENKVAIIAGSTSNFDKTASDNIFALKSELLKNSGEQGRKQWEQLMYGGFNGFDNDKVKKVTRISVVQSGSGANLKYTVKCELDYKDDNVTSNGKYATALPTTNAYQHTFVQSEPPVIYFMYNPCVYNAEYMWDDYITLDTTGVPNGKKVKLYLIETADKISQNIKNVMTDNNIDFKSENLIENVNTAGSGRADRDQITTHFNVKTSSLADISVYTNKDLNRVNDTDSFSCVTPTETLNYSAPAASGTHFVKTLADDSEYEGRLYTLTVKLIDASDDSVVATYTGTRGMD